jgi:hypothetical protein
VRATGKAAERRKNREALRYRGETQRQITEDGSASEGEAHETIERPEDRRRNRAVREHDDEQLGEAADVCVSEEEVEEQRGSELEQQNFADGATRCRLHAVGQTGLVVPIVQGLSVANGPQDQDGQLFRAGRPLSLRPGRGQLSSRILLPD